MPNQSIQFTGDIPNVRISDYPQLMLICWSRDRNGVIPEDEALALYERNWMWIEPDILDANEKAFLDRIVNKYGNGILNV